ncbi:hypothetical protein PR202_gb25623 [Eleusine coracana subsp. coracana]|uniref:Uncharacterized protein n=1 Tax=Eleusine coracana subsp. coracana TaxID=191504 RepID=A0AAV5FPZ5_ELECO|nr:hypothetical protein PR202_gb25623 [Eleusine coracana subsp. coracana]
MLLEITHPTPRPLLRNVVLATSSPIAAMTSALPLKHCRQLRCLGRRRGGRPGDVAGKTMVAQQHPLACSPAVLACNQLAPRGRVVVPVGLRAATPKPLVLPCLRKWSASCLHHVRSLVQI